MKNNYLSGFIGANVNNSRDELDFTFSTEKYINTIQIGEKTL